jgi:hypothetical protein
MVCSGLVLQGQVIVPLPACLATDMSLSVTQKNFTALPGIRRPHFMQTFA